jgi:hypothetical protein
LDIKNTIKPHYAMLLDKHKESFNSIAKTTTDVILFTISSSIENFKDIIKALPQTTQITSPGRPKQFVEHGIKLHHGHDLFQCLPNDASKFRKFQP